MNYLIIIIGAIIKLFVGFCIGFIASLLIWYFIDYVRNKIMNYKNMGIDLSYDKTDNDDWILTKDKMPPIGTWVLVTQNYSQKPWEIMCYQGIEIGTCWDSKNNFKEEHYEYPTWTSGHGDIMSHNPIAWMPLPIPYGWKIDFKTGEFIKI